MDINKIIKQLRSERDEIERAIIALEKYVDEGDRRTRPEETEEEAIREQGELI